MRRSAPYIIAVVLAVIGGGTAWGLNAALRAAVALPEGAQLESVDSVIPPSVVGSASPSPELAPSGGAAPAAAVGDAIGGENDPQDDGKAAQNAPVPGVPVTQRSLDQYRAAIFNRNIFDHTANPESAPESNGEPEPSDLNLRLVATLVAEPARYSSALITETGKESSTAGYGIGDRVGSAEIIAIDFRRVALLRSNGNTEYLFLEDKGTAPVDAGPSASTPAGDGSVEGGVTQLGDNHYAVERGVIDKYLTDLTALSGMGRAIPHRGADGEVDGYRLSGVRRNSVLFQLGIRNGDVIHQVNGSSLASMQDAMTAYQGLQSQSRFNFDITRRGQKQTMEYEVR